MPKPKRKRLLFVDDFREVHQYTKGVGKGHSQRHALSPQEAAKLVAKRIRAAERLHARKMAQYKAEKSPKKKAALKKELCEFDRSSAEFKYMKNPNPQTWTAWSKMEKQCQALEKNKK